MRIEGTRQEFDQALSVERLRPTGKVVGKNRRYYWAGALSVLHIIRNNFLPSAYIRSNDMEQLEHQICKAISEINSALE